MRDDDAVFRALADRSRRHVLDALNARDGRTLGDLVAGLDMTRQAVAKHVAVLEEAGLVVVRRVGREKHHHLNPAPLGEIADRWIRTFDRSRVDALTDLKRALEEPAMTTDTTTEFVYVTYIRTTAEQLWEALTNPEFVRRYYGGGGPESDWTVGSPVRWSMTGEPAHDWDQHVLEADRPRRLAYTWHNYQPEMVEFSDFSDDDLPRLRQEPISRVAFEIEQAGPDAVKLTVVHDGFVPGSEMLRGVSGGWPGILSNLKSLLETGDVVVA
ncbi:metalloregulator ArsR/SmtB family transcription factor [Actinomycetospora sp. OC33-EN08]|uniref:Metalloregulator ArsR/SmtB family transcription factor n=1 Tax=Actinomycetospora aurantiaca TaxID=3129233 RepID=A0ABU8MJ82_9PSEU